MNPEIGKYIGIYSSPDRYRGYGHTNHGKKALGYVQSLQPQSLVDVGCGHNEFKKALSAQVPCRIVGVDFACPSADIQADVLELPFARKEFDVLTAFDTMEHLRPEQIPRALDEMARVSQRFVFSISYVDSVNRWEGQTLHPTVKPESWWIDRIKQAGGKPRKEGNYLVGDWELKPCAPHSPVAVVGNGPSIRLRGERGSEIDAHDEVVRFNAFSLEGFEAFAGSKTTMWSTFGRGVLPAEAAQRPERVILSYGWDKREPPYPAKEVFRISWEFYKRVRARLKLLTARTGEPLFKLIPSSGLLVSLWLIEEMGCLRVHLYGVDHFSKEQSSQHHYWVPKAYGRPTEHDGDAEKLLLKPYADAGILEYR